MYSMPSFPPLSGQPSQDDVCRGQHGRGRAHHRPQELRDDPHDVDRAAAAEGAHAGGDARADVWLQAHAQGPPVGAGQAGGELQAGDGEAQSHPRPGVRTAADAVLQGPGEAPAQTPGGVREKGKILVPSDIFIFFIFLKIHLI